MTGYSVEAIEWLENDVAKRPIFQKPDGSFYPIQTFLKGGEKRIIHNNQFYYIDGFINLEGVLYGFEYKGCR